MNAVVQRVRREDGVSAVIVVISMVAILGGAMLSIDSGSVWKTRRRVITDTDSAALAAARHIDANGTAECNQARSGGVSSDAADEARYVMTQNDQDATLESLEVFPLNGTCQSEAGRVRVGGRLPANLTFAPVFGINDIRAFSSSTAQYGPLATAIGLRPVGICDKSEHFREWMDHINTGRPLGTGPGHHNYGGPIVHRIYFQRGSSGCGVGTGNWDWLDYNGTRPPSGTDALVEWFLNGYPGEVSIGDPTTGRARDCDPEEPGNQDGCAPKTGAGGGSLLDAMRSLRDNGTVFPISVYDRVVDERDPEGCNSTAWTGSGTNARYCSVAFLLVRVYGWDRITGQLTDDSYLDLEFIDAWWTGSIGGNPSGNRPTVHGVALCGGNYGGTIDEKCDV